MELKVISTEFVKENYVEKEIIENILNTLKNTENYKRENIIEDLELALKGGNEIE